MDGRPADCQRLASSTGRPACAFCGSTGPSPFVCRTPPLCRSRASAPLYAPLTEEDPRDHPALTLDRPQTALVGAAQAPARTSAVAAVVADGMARRRLHPLARSDARHRVLGHRPVHLEGQAGLHARQLRQHLHRARLLQHRAAHARHRCRSDRRLHRARRAAGHLHGEYCQAGCEACSQWP